MGVYLGGRGLGIARNVEKSALHINRFSPSESMCVSEKLGHYHKLLPLEIFRLKLFKLHEDAVLPYG